MHPTRRYVVASVAGILALLLCLSPIRTAETLPAQLTNEEFWKLVSDFSELDGNFPSNNYVSNERSYQEIFGALAEGRQSPSAYIGVGPEQNFSYIVALKPQIAFVVDIRRQNMIEHLMYKALFELSGDRAEFLSRLFSRPRPQGISKTSTVDTLMDAFERQRADTTLFQDNLSAIEKRLIQDHGFGLSDSDRTGLQKVFQAFRDGGPDLTYNGFSVVSGAWPTFGDIMKQTGKDGTPQGFLATEEKFQSIRDLEEKNLLIPIVGDFAGPKAVRSIGDYLKTHSATVTAFYTSNVEQYLFQDDLWPGFYSNVSTLPVNSKSVFIRGLIRSSNGEYSPSPGLPSTSHYETGLFAISELIDAFKGGSIRVYNDILLGKQ